MATEKKTLSNEHISIDIETLPQCKIKIKGTLKQAVVKDCYKDATKEISKKVEMPGFRKGKVPPAMLEKNFKKDMVAKTKELALQKTLLETLILSKLHILQTHPTLRSNFKVFDVEKDCTFELEFQVEAEVPDIDLKDIKIKKTKEEAITQTHIDDMIERMQHYFAEFKEVKRKIKENDFVDLDIYDEEQKQMIFNDKRFRVNKKSMALWMFDALKDKEVGQTFEQTSTLDVDAPKEVKDKFKPTKCKITIKKIVEGSFPDVDEAFAKKVGSNNVEDLHKNAKKMLEQQSKEKVKEEDRTSLIEAILKKHPFEIPEVLLSTQKELLLKELVSRLSDARALDKDIIERKKDLEHTAEIQAKKIIQTYLLTQKIAKEEKIEVSQNEIISHLLKVMPQQAMQILNDPNQTEKRDAMIQDTVIYLTQNKVLDLLIEKLSKD
ncbi:MAG: Trigger factor [Chlamydiae bacterium]|nr:Trigger factor [Chlamydiota bacterium]